MASVKNTIDNICAVSTGHQSKIQSQWRGTLSFYHTNLSQLPLSEDKIVTLLCDVSNIMQISWNNYFYIRPSIYWNANIMIGFPVVDLHLELESETRKQLLRIVSFCVCL